MAVTEQDLLAILQRTVVELIRAINDLEAAIAAAQPEAIEAQVETTQPKAASKK